MSLFATILLGRNVLPPPQVGAGRIHRLKDDIEELPCQADRLLAILKAIRTGATSVSAIQEKIGFRIERSLLVADCEELAERDLVTVARRPGVATRYLPRG